ncbi:MAG: VWA domain-containing protein [Agitococcus sp.]
MDISKGQRTPISQLVTGQSFQLAVSTVGALVVDISCFGLDAAQKLSDERYMTFFNQPKTPCGGVAIVQSTGKDTTTFHLNLALLPASIDRLVITAAIDGTGTMNQLRDGCYLRFVANGQESSRFNFSGQDFAQEKALMLGELYRKNGEWRFCATAQGFNGGLEALVKHFGGEVAAPTTSVTAAISSPVVEQPKSPPKLSLEKKVAKDAPQLLSLAKKAQISLEKKKLGDVQAQVALVLDASGSMFHQYFDGTVQKVIERILPLAVHFDDDGALDCWGFGCLAYKLDSVTLKNVKNYTKHQRLDDDRGLSRFDIGNDEPVVIKEIIKYYKKSKSSLPAYVVFISDGGVGSDDEIEELLRESASLPIFWQFVGIGGSDYGILENLDTMMGRVVDNCNFFALDDLHQISEQELYDRLLEEFPQWLTAAKAKSIIR